MIDIALISTAEVRRRTEDNVADDSGYVKDPFVVVEAKLPFRLIRQREQWLIGPSGEMHTGSYTGLTTHNADILEGDRIVVDGIEFDVRAVDRYPFVYTRTTVERVVNQNG